jgi:hypothetical protein
MKDFIFPVFCLLTLLAKLLRPGGGRTLIAENLLLKQQLIIHSRSRQGHLISPPAITPYLASGHCF